MDTLAYSATYQREKTYWWHSARIQIIKYLRKKLAAQNQPVILNLGCGTGILSKELADKNNIISLDNHIEALKYCKERELKKLLCGNALKLPFKNNSLNEIYALDIIEHLEKDQLGLQEIYRCLKSTGFAIITVPAYPFLWSKMDNIAKHYHRYRKRNFHQLLQQVGFSIEICSYYNFFMFPFALLHKLIKSRITQNEEEVFIPSLPKWLNFIFKNIFAVEKYLLPYLHLPFGVSLIAVVRKQ